MASLSKQGKGKFRRRPAARENFSGHGKGKLRANGKSKLPSRQMANGNGKVCRGKGQRTPVKWQRETVSVYGKGKASSLHGKGKFRHGKGTLGKRQGQWKVPRRGKLFRRIHGKFLRSRHGKYAAPPMRTVRRSHGM